MYVVIIYNPNGDDAIVGPFRERNHATFYAVQHGGRVAIVKSPSAVEGD